MTLGTIISEDQFLTKGDKHIYFRLSQWDTHSQSWIQLSKTEHGPTLRMYEMSMDMLEIAADIIQIVHNIRIEFPHATFHFTLAIRRIVAIPVTIMCQPSMEVLT